MSIIAEFTIPAEAFALHQTFDALPDITIEAERLATHSREWVMPFLWVTGDDIDAIERALRADPSIDDVQCLTHEPTIGQFNVTWGEQFQQLIDEIVNHHGIMQEAEATDGTWSLKLNFITQDALQEFQAYFHERGYSFQLQRLYEGTAPKDREYDLTPEQREALVTALQLGYYSIPREADAGDVADALGISTNALSQRLRRGTRNLLENTLTRTTPSGSAKSN